MVLDTLTCRAVALAAWQVSENRTKWPSLRQSYERDLTQAAEIFTTLATDSADADLAELREILKDLGSEDLQQVGGSLTTMAHGNLVDDDVAQFIYFVFGLLDPRPPITEPVLSGSRRDS